MSVPRNLLGGHCCALGMYNTSRTSKTLFEPSGGVWKLYQAAAYLQSIQVKISSTATDTDYEVLVLDTQLSAQEIIDGGLDLVWERGGYAVAYSDVKGVGGVFSDEPGAEEFIFRKCTCDGCRLVPGRELMIPINRPIEQGLAVALITAADGEIATEADAVWIDARYAQAALMG